MATNRAVPPAFEDAFQRLELSLSRDDSREFRSTTLQDVKDAAAAIEKEQVRRKCLRNMRRIEPFVRRMEEYSRVIEVFCQGYPLMSFGPIKLMLQLATEHTKSFDALLDAYSRIAEALPRFDRYRVAFIDNPDFQGVLGLVYADILEFHRHAYKFFRRRAWKIIFDSLWKSFGHRFDGILADLTRHKDLVDREALSIGLVEAQAARKKALEGLNKEEKKRRATELREVLTWLAVDRQDWEDDLDRIAAKRQPGTCDWFINHSKVRSWVSGEATKPILWLTGIPGSGKSILCSQLIEHIQGKDEVTVAYYFCSHSTSRKATDVMRSIAAQLIMANLDLLPHVVNNYVDECQSPSLSTINKLLSELVSNIQSSRIIVDGVDEYDDQEQKRLLLEILQLCQLPEACCKLFISSREMDSIKYPLRTKPDISLKEQRREVDHAIGLYIRKNLNIKERFRSISDAVINDIEQKVNGKAGGMFLWVRLVISILNECFTLRDLQNAVDALPEGIKEIYDRILDRIRTRLTAANRDRAFRVLEWVTCSYRPLKIYELEGGIAFGSDHTILDETTKVQSDLLTLCAPILEETADKSVGFVHFSAKEYFLIHKDFVNAHYSIALSCGAYLSGTFLLMKSSISEEEVTSRVMKEYHGLHNYANEFWLEHVLEYSRLMGTIESGVSSDLARVLGTLTEVHKKPYTLQLDHESAETGESISCLKALNTPPAVRRLIRDILLFRETLREYQDGQISAQAYRDYEVESDPTFFSDMARRIQDATEELLEKQESDFSMATEVAQLKRFKDFYGSSGFTCPFCGCPRASEGFKTKIERDRHESTHTRQHKCWDSDCEFFVLGFTTRTALNRHNRRYHTRTEESEIPSSLQPHRADSDAELLIAPQGTAATTQESSKAFNLPLQMGQISSYYPPLGPPTKQDIMAMRTRLPLNAQSISDAQVRNLIIRLQLKNEQEKAREAASRPLQQTSMAIGSQGPQSNHQQPLQQHQEHQQPIVLQNDSITPQEYVAIGVEARKLAENTPKEDLRRIRANLQKISEHQKASLKKQGIDPLLYFFRTSALKNFKLRKARQQLNSQEQGQEGTPESGK
ncbi:MAG: hypothetical protein M1813_000528 [Trichoglossum hirsutum]|nr:MAG: hypothetical protein M1813_000528 [Trichoglossum hirsutum]